MYDYILLFIRVKNNFKVKYFQDGQKKIYYINSEKESTKMIDNE